MQIINKNEIYKYIGKQIFDIIEQEWFTLKNIWKPSDRAENETEEDIDYLWLEDTNGIDRGHREEENRYCVKE